MTVDIDPRTGEPTIYSEKEVVDSIIDNRTEVLLDVAVRAGYTDAEYGDLVMVDSTTAGFGRIARSYWMARVPLSRSGSAPTATAAIKAAPKRAFSKFVIRTVFWNISTAI